MEASYDLLQKMYKKMNFIEFSSALDEMIARNDFKMVGVFLDKKMVGVSGYWISFMLYCGRYLQVSSLVVDEDNRSNGIGRIILNYLEEKAKNFNCKKLVLDSYTENKKSHSLYFRQGFYIRGFHFMKDIN